MTLAAIPKGWFAKAFRVMEGTRQVAEIDMSWWREQGVLTIEGVPYRVYREKLMSGDFILEIPCRFFQRPAADRRRNPGGTPDGADEVSRQSSQQRLH